MIEKKKVEFSFEVKEESQRQSFPEIEEVQELIDKAAENYELLRSLGNFKEAKSCLEKLRDIKFA